MTDLSKESDTLGYPALVPDTPARLRYLHNQRIGKVLIKRPDQLRADYLYYLLRTQDYRNEVLASATGTTVKHTSPSRIARYEFHLPSIDEQLSIAGHLGALDDKIELNRKMNVTLETMARALFKSWFVDFDPVRAKAEGRDTGLPPRIAALFPDSFETSELGQIPKGWPVESIGAHVEAAKGLSYKGEGLTDSGTPLHNLNSIYEGGGYKYEGIKHYRGEFRERHIAIPGDVIVANTEQGHDRLLIGYAAIVPERFGEEALFSHHIYRVKLRAESPLTAQYVSHLLNSTEMHDIVSGYANGTTVNMLPIEALQAPSIVVPPVPLVSAFDSLARTTSSRRELLEAETRSLAEVRDTLLPKLLSGEIRVGEASRMLAEAGV